MTSSETTLSEAQATNGTPIMIEDRITITQLSPQVSAAITLEQDIREGFAQNPPQLPPKYFYDIDGSGIFEQIVRLPEYYVGRLETEVLTEHAEDIVGRGSWGRLVELGSGASEKMRSLLSALHGDTPIYSPFDISKSALAAAAKALTKDCTELEI